MACDEAVLCWCDIMLGAFAFVSRVPRTIKMWKLSECVAARRGEEGVL